MDEEATFERIQRRLIDRGRFQLKQTIILQDDEIERLRDKLSDLQSKILRHKTIWARKIARRQNKVTEAKKRLNSAKEKTRGRLNEVSKEYALRVSAMQDFHDERLRDVSHESKMFMKKQEASRELEHQESSAIIEHTMRNVSQRIDILNKEKELEAKLQAKQAKKKIDKVKLRSEALKKRIDELTAVIATENETYWKWKSKHEMQMSDIQEKLEDFASEVSQSKCRYLTRMNEMEDLEEEPEELEDLRRKVYSAQKRKEKLQDKVDKLRASFEVSHRKLEDEKSELERKNSDSQIEESQIPAIKSKIQDQKEITRDLLRQIEERDPELQKLRDKNLKLSRRLKEIDYSVNGRTGGFQRLTEITEHFD